MRLVWVVVPLVLLVMITLFPTQEVLACSCYSASNIEHYDRSDAVFVGTVLQIEESTSSHGPDGEFIFDIHQVTFDVHSKWKGELNDIVLIETMLPNGANCGKFFQNNTSYLIFADITDNGNLGTSSCSGSKMVSLDYEPNFVQHIILGSVPYLFFPLWKLILIISISAIIIIVFVVRKKIIHRLKKENNT